MSPTLAEQIEETVDGLRAQVPAEVLAPFVQESEQRRADGVPPGAVRPGDALPDGELLDAHGNPTTVTATRAGRPAVVVFYRGAWCPYCNVALRAYEQVLAGPLAERGIALIAISPQKPDGALSVQETNALTYDVLSDPGNQIAGALDILVTQLEGTRASQATLGLDVAASNADGTDTLPMPTVLLAGADGTVRWVEIRPDHAERTEPQAILDAITEAGL